MKLCMNQQKVAKILIPSTHTAQMAKTQQKRTGLVFGTSKATNGFTLIELLVVIAIIGLMAIGIPRFIGKRSTAQTFVERLNLILQKAYNNACTTGDLHKVVIHLKDKYIDVEQETKDKQGQKKFQALPSQYQASMPIDSTIEFEKISIDGTDELALGDPKKVWFFIVPNGLAQNVTIGIQETDAQNKTMVHDYTLNPFAVQFEQTPSD